MDKTLGTSWLISRMWFPILLRHHHYDKVELRGGVAKISYFLLVYVFFYCFKELHNHNSPPRWYLTGDNTAPVKCECHPCSFKYNFTISKMSKTKKLPKKGFSNIDTSNPVTFAYWKHISHVEGVVGFNEWLYTTQFFFNYVVSREP